MAPGDGPGCCWERGHEALLFCGHGGPISRPFLTPVPGPLCLWPAHFLACSPNEGRPPPPHPAPPLGLPLISPSRRRRPAPLQHSHREHPGRGEAGGGVLQDEERECSLCRCSSGRALLSHSHPPPLPFLARPCLAVHKAPCLCA